MRIAVAVREGNDLLLVVDVVREATTDVYVNWPRDYDPNWKPHTSYHASGQHHQKSHGKQLGVQRAPKPDATFMGTRQVVSTPLTSGAHISVNVRIDPRDFYAVFEIRAALLRFEKGGSFFVSVDLAEPGCVPPLQTPSAKVVQEQTYKEAEPWIVIRLQEVPPFK